MSTTRPIQLVLQIAETGARSDVAGDWKPNSTLEEVMNTAKSQLSSSLLSVSFEGASLRFVQTAIDASKWKSTKLKDIGLTGRALLILKSAPTESSPEPMEIEKVNSKSSSSDENLQKAAQFLLNNNFDVDTKLCIVTLIKVIDNILQKPAEPKVRSIRLANASFQKKVVERKGGVEYLLACGFQRQQTPTPMLSKMEKGEDSLVLSDTHEDQKHLISARRILTLTATKDLLMKADELPKYKTPAKLTTAATTNQFDPYKGHRYDAKSAATGTKLGPDENYVSPTEQKLNDLKTQQSKLEKKFHRPLEDRQLVALMPNAKPPPPPPMETAPAHSDGNLLALQFKKREEQRKQREEAGFTTKAMRDLKAMKHKKVYSHAKLRVQFPDATALEAKFLPNETVQTVVNVIKGTFMEQCADFQFDLYVSPPRRKLDGSKTLDQEELVPAAKIFLSWKNGPLKDAPIGSYVKSDLFQGTKPSYPSGKSLSQPLEDSKPAAKKSKPAGASREDDMLRRMLGGKGGLGGTKSGTSGGAKPKWFKK